MAAETASSIIRAALTTDFQTPVSVLIEKVKAAGIKATPESLKNLSYNIRSQMKKKAGKLTTPVKSVARKTPKPQPRPATPVEMPVTAPAPVATPAAALTDVSSVLANVALVNNVVGLVGGPAKVRQLVEAVRACGGVEVFLQHLELVVGIKSRA